MQKYRQKEKKNRQNKCSEQKKRIMKSFFLFNLNASNK